MTAVNTPERPIGLTLKLERIEAGVSLTDLAQALGLSIGHLSNIEAGKRSASPELIDRIRGVIRGRAAA